MLLVHDVCSIEKVGNEYFTTTSLMAGYVLVIVNMKCIPFQNFTATEVGPETLLILWGTARLECNNFKTFELLWDPAAFLKH